MKNNLVILMATYNGEKYLRDQIDSILKQTYKDWNLIVRDDNSKDGTYDILKEYAARYPQKIMIVKNTEGEKHGAKENFFALSKIACKQKYNYFMFSDQDDIWHEDKIQVTLDKIKNIEITRQTPALVHTDLKVVDSNLNEISSSFVEYSKLDLQKVDYRNLMIQNNVTGCTVLCNRALLEVALKVNSLNDIIMHDWWFALVAAVFGKVGYISKATMLYRQHENNVVGAKSTGIKAVLERLNDIDSIHNSLIETQKQTRLLYNSYKNIPKNKAAIIKKYAFLSQSNKFERIRFVTKNKILKQGVTRRIGELVFI